MTELNLTATDSRQQTVLEHLIPIVSDTLTEKINNGVYIEKDGKRLLNKKDLTTFMLYAEEQAKKMISEQQRKGSQAVCVHGDDIMSWAIHYFEEDSIEGNLYNEDGTEYKPVVKAANKPVAPVNIEPPKPKQQQTSLWDMMTATENKPEIPEQADEHEIVDVADEESDMPKQPYNSEPIKQVEDDPSIDEIADKLQQAIDEKNGAVHTVEQSKIISDCGKTIDADTGEVLSDGTEQTEKLFKSDMRAFDGDMIKSQSLEEESNSMEVDEQSSTVSPSSFDEDTAIYLLKLLDSKMDIM